MRPAGRLCYLVAADRELDRLDALFAKASMPLREGAWLGPLRLDADRVASAKLATGFPLDAPLLAIRLEPQWREPLALITKHAIGTRLAIRLAGEVIASPLITESVTDGSIHLGGPDRQTLARFADAIGIRP